MINKLLSLGYHYNFDKKYLFKTIKSSYDRTFNTIRSATAFYENNKFNKIVLDCMPVEELKAFLVSFIKQAKEKDIK